MTTVFLVSAYSDPYEPAFQMAICTSMRKVFELKLDNLWDNKVNENGDWDCTNLITGEFRVKSKYGFPPTPFIEEVELDKQLFNERGEPV